MRRTTADGSPPPRTGGILPQSAPRRAEAPRTHGRQIMATKTGRFSFEYAEDNTSVTVGVIAGDADTSLPIKERAKAGNIQIVLANFPQAVRDRAALHGFAKAATASTAAASTESDRIDMIEARIENWARGVWGVEGSETRPGRLLEAVCNVMEKHDKTYDRAAIDAMLRTADGKKAVQANKIVMAEYQRLTVLAAQERAKATAKDAKAAGDTALDELVTLTGAGDAS